MIDLFETADQREAKSKAFLEKVFPQGLEQRDKIQNILTGRYPKHDTKQLLFNYIIMKELLIDDKKDKAIKQFKKIKPKLDETQKNEFIALIESDIDLKI